MESAGKAAKHLHGKKMNPKNPLAKIYAFYRDGFRSMTVGRTLWIVILVKLFIIFVVLRLFFFHDFLGKFKDGPQREDYVRGQLIERSE